MVNIYSGNIYLIFMQHAGNVSMGHKTDFHNHKNLGLTIASWSWSGTWLWCDALTQEDNYIFL